MFVAQISEQNVFYKNACILHMRWIYINWHIYLLELGTYNTCSSDDETDVFFNSHISDLQKKLYSINNVKYVFS